MRLHCFSLNGLLAPLKWRSRAALLLLGIGPHAAAQSADGFAPADGLELYYHTYGDGPLLLLNGGPGLASSYLALLARHFSDAHRVILFGAARAARHSALSTRRR